MHGSAWSITWTAACPSHQCTVLSKQLYESAQHVCRALTRVCIDPPNLACIYRIANCSPSPLSFTQKLAVRGSTQAPSCPCLMSCHSHATSPATRVHHSDPGRWETPTPTPSPCPPPANLRRGVGASAASPSPSFSPCWRRTQRRAVPTSTRTGRRFSAGQRWVPFSAWDFFAGDPRAVRAALHHNGANACEGIMPS